MSDPVTNVEIEDVLSSIRRLVTEESRSGQRKAEAAKEEGEDRLVLTPALRVAEPDESPAPSEPYADSDETSEEWNADSAAETAEAEKSDTPWKDPNATLYEAAQTAESDVPWYRQGLEETAEAFETREAADIAADVAEALNADVLQLADPILPTTDEPQDSAPDTTAPEMAEPDVQEDAPVASPQVAEQAEAVEADDGEAHPNMPEQAVAAPDTQPDDHIEPVADFEPAAQNEAYDVEAAYAPEAREDAQQVDPEPISESALDPDSDDTMSDFVEQPEGVDATPLEPEHGGAGLDADRAATLSAKIEALEAAIAETRDQWEPDGDTGDDYAGTHVETIAWQDHTPDIEPEPAPEPRPDVAEDLSSLASDEAILDEESLRELVADIVREELQGVLGERITRNVRKLVRREIHRALTTQELD